MKMILAAFLLISFAHAADPKLDPKQERWNQLMKLINQEMTILSSAKRKDDGFFYRMLELHSEKLKLIHEKNNREFMENAVKANSGQGKDAYFAETRAYYEKTKQFGHMTIQKFPNTTLKAPILFALALNSRDYGKDKITERYLLDTIFLVKDPHHSLRHHAETALADFYYNEKRYQDAITYYKRAITKTEDEWLTKHLFNLSWCYLKVREFDLAISTITQSYFQSKNKAYVNIKDQVLENIGSFYVYAGRPLEGLDFYLKNEQDPIPYLMPMAHKTSSKGHEKETEVILGAAQKLIDKNGWFQHQEELFHSYLDFYRHYNRFDDHEKSSRLLVAYYKKAAQAPELKLKVELKDDAIEKMRTLAGFLQIKLAKDMKKDESNYKDGELNLVLNFFNHLIQLDPTRKVEYFYFRAETYYSVRRFKDAAPSYVETVVEAKVSKNEEHARKALNSLLALTGLEVIEKNDNKKYLVFAYSEYLGFWPRDEKSELIYPKLFEIYRDGQDDVRATQVLRAFNKHYPEHLAEQQKLMTKVLDQFIEKQATEKLAEWIQEFKTGFLSFAKATIEKTEIVLGNILFLQYQEMAKKGDKVAAAKGFETIFAHKLYPDKVKYQAAFFAALTYLELGETVKSYHWQAQAYLRMTEKEKLERRDEQLKMTERTYKLQDFVTTYKLSNFLLKKFCSLRDNTQTRFFEIAVMAALVEEKPADAELVIKNFSNCLEKAETKNAALAQIYQHHEKLGAFFALKGFVSAHKSEPFLSQYRYTLQKWYWEQRSFDIKGQILNELRALKHQESAAWLAEISLHEKALVQKEDLLKAIVWNKPVFDGNEFNKSLEQYLLKLQSFRNSYQQLMQSSQIDLAIISTRMFSEVYMHVGVTIQGLRPQGMDEATYKDFSIAMKGLAKDFIAASGKYEKQLEIAVHKKETLTWGSRSIASVEEIENPVFSFFTGLTMDKGRE